LQRAICASSGCVLRRPGRPAERFVRLRRELGDGFEGIEIDSSPGNPHGIDKRSHSVLTVHLWTNRDTRRAPRSTGCCRSWPNGWPVSRAT
jgi:hypothetical protein